MAAAWLVRRIGLVGAAEEAFYVARREAPGHARGAHEQARSRRRVSGGIGLLDERGDVALPGAVVGLCIAEAGSRLLAVAAGGAEGTRVRRGRFLIVAGVGQDIAELEAERGSERPVLRGLELHLQELLDHVDLAEPPVDRARLLQRFDQRGVELERVLEVLQRLHGVEELVLQYAAEAEVIRRLDGRIALGRDAFLQLLDQSLPVTNGLEMIQTLRKIHSFYGPRPDLQLS